MKVRGLILVLLVPWLVHAEQQYYGTRVSQVLLSGTDSQADLQVIPVRRGDVITVENVRDAIQKLYDTGRYATIEVDATTTADGTVLTFRVRRNFFFATFKLEPENLLERPLSAYFRLPLGEKFSETAVERVVQDTKELLKTQGYFEPAIKPEYNLDETTTLASVIVRTDAGPKATIGNVTLQGGEQTFSAADLLSAFDVKSGNQFSAGDVEKGLANARKKFIDLGFLNTLVKIDRQYQASTKTVDLKITVEPGQFTLVQTRGFEISKKKIRELIPVFEEGTVDPDLVEEGRVNVDRYMQQEGYFEATVTSEQIEAPKDNAIQINYTIDSGPRHRIASVEIAGNQHFSDDEIRNRIRLRRSQLLNRGVFSREQLDDDVRIVSAMYQNAGFMLADVRGSYEEKDHVVYAVIRIEEGERFPIDHIAFLGNTAVDEKELRQDLHLKEGDLYTPIDMDRSRSELITKYYTKGYADVRVDATADRNPANHGMQVRFQISEGEPYQIGNVLVAGSTLTKEKVIRRTSKLNPFTPYNPEAILEAQQLLYATSLFTRVEIVTLQEKLPRIRNVLISVEDAKPILVSYGVGYQEFERARGTIEVSHNNLFGVNRSISVRVRGSQRERRFQSTFREPHLFNWNVDGFASLFAERAKRKFYDANRIDFALQTLKRFSPQQNLVITASYQTADLRPETRLIRRAFEKSPEDQGVFQIARIGGSFIQDRRDDPINPTTGSFQSTTFQVATRILASEVNFTSFFNQSNYYMQALHGVVASSVRLGWNHAFGGTQRIPISERYFAGGSTTLRGLALDEAQPPNRPGVTLLPGGNVMTIGNVEYRVPLRIFPIRGIGGALFYDSGNVFPRVSEIRLKDFNHSAGFGLRYQTPLGPVRLDMGINLNPRQRPTDIPNVFRREERVHFFFTLGNPF